MEGEEAKVAPRELLEEAVGIVARLECLLLLVRFPSWLSQPLRGARHSLTKVPSDNDCLE